MRRPALVLALSLSLTGVTAGPAVVEAVAATDGTLTTISSSALRASVDDAFPRVASYTDIASGAVMYGNEDTLSQVTLNGTNYTPTVTSTVATDHVDYTLTFVAYGNIAIDVTLKVTGRELDLNVTRIADTTANPVRTLAFPGHNLVSVRSSQTGAALASAKMNTATTGTGDTFSTLTSTTQTDASPVSSMYAIVNTSQLAASVSSNSYYDAPSGTTATENGRVKKQTVDKGTYRRLGIWSGDWLYRSTGSSASDTEPLPWAKVTVTGDRNADSTVDWQDGAIAYRDIMTSPQGWEKVAERPVMRIPFNFASQATHPFLQTLDETKKIALNTDGLGQFVLLKGYGSEGHDSAHPDYALVGQRQGGTAELNTLVNAAGAYNADIGVHIQDTEEYPVAKSFSESLANNVQTDLGWDWLDQSYHIDYRKDGQQGTRLARLQAFRNAVPNLNFLYIDTWYGDGYTTQKFAREMNNLGYDIATEFPDKFVDQAVWTHWANDINYGGSNYKGINSQIARFIRNHQLDDWIAGHPLLGGGDLAAFEGWQGKTDYNAFLRTTFSSDLPTKYLQGSPITKWTSSTITLANGASVTTSGSTRQISKDGHLILNGGSYLLPWDQTAETKLYHWNTAGGSTTWTLPTSWGSPSTVKLYKLTDTGRQFVSDLTVTSRQVSISATANTPYVVYPADPGANANPNWGEGGKVADPGFYSGGLSAWTVTGDTTKASVATTSVGQKQLQVASGNGTTVSQQLTGLTGGQTYAASVYVATSGGRKATLSVTPTGGTAVSNWTDNSLFTNNAGGDEYNSTKMQRMRVLFDVPSGQSTATLSLTADTGTATVSFDNVRVVPVTRTPQGTHYFVEDFENVDAGWFPFVVGDAAGSKTDPRTHIAQLNAPYTQAGWNGHLTDDVLNGGNSLKSHEERQGLIYRTLPQTLRFQAGHTYTVKFTYEATNSGEYQFVTGAGVSTQTTTNINQARTPTTFTATVTASAAGDTFIGVLKTATGADTGNQQHDLMIDDLTVDDNGGGGGGPSRVPQSQMTVKYVDSQETTGENGAATNVLDGNSATIWHTKWYGGSDPLPHEIQLDLGASYSVSCLYYLPRSDSANGRIANYEVYTSTDGTTWGTAAKTGTWTNVSTEEQACFTARTARYVRLRALTEVNGNAWTSAAELNVGYEPVVATRLPQSQMTVTYVDSEDTATGGQGSNVLDGDSTTLWHTAWSQVDPDPVPPHEIRLDLGASHSVSCLYYLPRQSGTNGRIANYEVYTSTDGTTWGTAAKTGTWTNTATEQSACFTARTARYVRLRALSEVNGGAWTSVAELNIEGT